MRAATLTALWKRTAFRTLAVSALIGVAMWPTPAIAHFQTLIPSNDVLPLDGERTVTFDITFTHPMSRGPTMPMGADTRFGVLGPAGDVDLTPTLEPTTVDGAAAFKARYRATAPGAHTFHLTPAPYWDRDEDKFIQHHAKVGVDFGGGDGWDALVGAPVEIKPLTRPFGLWTGNVFRGVALVGGAPLADAMVEIEWLNDGTLSAPNDALITQEVKTDDQGVFVFGIPKAGWWGINALTTVPMAMTAPDGRRVSLELGGTLWIKAVDMR